MPDLAPPERTDEQLIVAVPVEVRRARIGDARESAEYARQVPSIAAAAQPHDSAKFAITRKKLPKICDQQIAKTIAIDIDELGASGMWHIGQDRQRSRGIGRVAAKHEAVTHVRRDDLQDALSFEIEKPNVRDRRRLGKVTWLERMDDETR